MTHRSLALFTGAALSLGATMFHASPHRRPPTAFTARPRPNAVGNVSVKRAPVVTAALAPAAPTASVDAINSGYPIERSACLTINLGPSAAAGCASLQQTAHAHVVVQHGRGTPLSPGAHLRHARRQYHPT